MTYNEKTRQSAVEIFKVLDDSYQSEFDDITKLISLICEVPITAVSILDGDRQWFKSRVGLEVEETPREWAFCDHAIRSEGLLIVEDARQDSRFVSNPLVMGEPHIRFYAGAPIVVENQPLGTLCVIDQIPRTLSENQVTALLTLRDSAARLIENNRALQLLETFHQLVPLCAWCNDAVRVGDEVDGDWLSLRDYLHSRGEVTHGICESCRNNID